MFCQGLAQVHHVMHIQIHLKLLYTIKTKKIMRMNTISYVNPVFLQVIKIISNGKQ